MAKDKLIDHYDALEAQWKVNDSSTNYGRLVVPAGNSDDSLHRWFHLKEAFSSKLLARLVKDASWSPSGEISVLDPFVGSGTSLLSALALAEQHNVKARLFGIERNPVIHIIAAAKTAAAMQGKSLIPAITKALPSVYEEYRRQQKRHHLQKTPSVTLNNEDYYPRSHVRSLISLRRSIELVEDLDVRLLLQTCLASAVEPAGRLRRDGRALRHVPERNPLHPRDVFEQQVEQCLGDLGERVVMPADWIATVKAGDARNAVEICGQQEFDWIVFSPPYPNNIDYTEVYKTEAWALGCYEDAVQMREQRLSTIRSHPSVRFPEDYWYLRQDCSARVEELIAPILEAVPKKAPYQHGRIQLVRGYADDMLRVLAQARALIKPNGYCVFVVGNSVHGAGDEQFVIAADLIMSSLAAMAGWKVEEIRVARWLARRGERMHHLRESVVCLKPGPLVAQTNDLRLF